MTFPSFETGWFLLATLIAAHLLNVQYLFWPDKKNKKTTHFKPLTHEKYQRTASKIPFHPKPNWVFAVVWLVLDVAMAIAVYYYYYQGQNNSTSMWQPVLAVYVAFFVTTKLWTPVFFGISQFSLAAAVLLVNVALGIALLSLLGIQVRDLPSDKNQEEILFLVVLAVRELWGCFAFYLNVMFAFFHSRKGYSRVDDRN